MRKHYTKEYKEYVAKMVVEEGRKGTYLQYTCRNILVHHLPRKIQKSGRRLHISL